MRVLRLTASCAALAAVVAATSSAAAGDRGRLTFERDVRPILKAYCLDCHGADEDRKGKLDLRLKRLAERGGVGGPAIVAGNPDESPLLDRLKSGEMPPGEKKVPAEQIALIERWIAEGAATLRPEPENLPTGVDITPEERAFWAYQPVRRPAAPPSGPADRVRTPVDAFVLAKLREKGLAFAPEADRLTLLRRASFDLTGLPPTPAEVDAFLNDPAPDAYERLIDRLLASPRYGERWGRHWLDVAGYSDSDGNGSDDTPRPYAYKYRDYVVRALNADTPLDRFLVEQLAGDELVPRPWANLTPAQAETLAATGFLRTAPDGTSSGSPDEPLASNQVVADTLKVVGSALYGLTVGCAQCHDHKYDPIPQVDYFRLRAVFEPALDPAHWRRPSQRLVSLYTDADRVKAAAIDAEAAKLQQAVDAKAKTFLAAALEIELKKHPEAARAALRDAYNAPPDKRTPAQKKLLDENPSVNISPGVLYQYNQAAADELTKDQGQVNAKRAEKRVEDFVSLLDEPAGARPVTHVFYRGDHRQPKAPVRPGDLTIVALEGQRFEVTENPADQPTSGRRLAFARHLTDGTHPLLGRVLVNRVWLNHFGRGLVDSPGDFGVLGLRPTHPELLDWLADELVQRGWSLKQLHRLLMTSTVYRQSSRREDGKDIADALYGRYPVRRLDAETLRDRILAASGRLDPAPFGPAVAVAEDAVGQVNPAGDSPRRSLYLQVRRSQPVSFLAAFDAPVMAVNCERRQSSTSAPQSLMLMNSDFVLGHARRLAERLRAETPTDFARDLVAPLAGRVLDPAAPWQFGDGAFDESTQRVVGFTPLPHWTGSSWQGGPALPDPTHGWALLHAAGGHAGNDDRHAAVRRWVAPRDGFVAVSGRLKHPSPNGNGVRGRVVSSREGLAGQWPVKTSEAATDVPKIAVRAGDTIDFVLDCLGDATSDSFEWPVRVALTDADGRAVGAWDSASGFHGPLKATLVQRIAYAWPLAYQRPVTAEELGWACDFVAAQLAAPGPAPAGDAELAVLTNLAQQLLSSNEFLYVD